MDFAERLAQYRVDRFRDGSGGICIDAEVYRRPARPGPPVILIHEAPGLSSSTLDIADALDRRGFAPVLPSLLSPPAAGGGWRRMVDGVARMCIAAEFGALTRGGSSPIASWLRALARTEAERTGQPVGIVGMCFSGGFALAAALEPAVKVAVISQPALPAIHPDDLGLTDRDLRRLQAQVGPGACLRVLRYERDLRSPRARYRRLLDAFPAIDPVEIPTTDRMKHSVLADGVGAEVGTDLRTAFDETLAFLATHLLPPDDAATTPTAGRDA